jgi:hypothetical protein
VSDDKWDYYNNSTTPCFVSSIGPSLESDATYVSPFGSYCFSIHIEEWPDRLRVIGSLIDDKKNFHASSSVAWHADDVPQWLHDQPVQRVLRLTNEPNEASSFALSPRVFTRDFSDSRMRWRLDEDRTGFRPAFSNRSLITPIRQNTIAAYLIQNFIEAGDNTIFASLKNDIIAKSAAVTAVVDAELQSFHDAFDKLYGV